MMNRGVTILLLASLAANVFLGGFVAGRMLGKPPHERHGGHGPAGMMFFGNLEPLSPDARASFRAVFRDNRDVLRKDFRELRQRRDTFGEALAADPWDRARAEQALAELRAVEDAHQTALAGLLIDAFEGLSPEDRKALIEAQSARDDSRRERYKSFRSRRGKHDSPDGPPPLPDEEAE